MELAHQPLRGAKIMRKLSIAAVLLLALMYAAPAIADTHDAFLNAKDEWGLFIGYGETIPGMGATRSRVEAIDLVGRYGYFLSNEKGGESWYRGRHEFMVELPVSYVYSPESAYMVGVHFFAVWNFTAPKGFIPYVFGGGGPIYTNLHVPELSRELGTARTSSAPASSGRPRRNSGADTLLSTSTAAITISQTPGPRAPTDL